MRAQTNLVKRGNVHYFRKKVPQDLRAHYGQESIRKSLGHCATLAEAKREAARLAAHYEVEFAQHRAIQQRQPLEAGRVPELVRAFEAVTLAADDEARGKGFSAEAFADYSAAIEAQLSEAKAAYARGATGAVGESVADLLHLAGLVPGNDLEAIHRLHRGALEARVRALKAIRERNEGGPVTTPAHPAALSLAGLNEGEDPEAVEKAIAGAFSRSTPTPEAARATSGHRLGNVVAYWETTGEKGARSVKAAATLVREFIELHGDIPLLDITKAHFVAFRDKLLQRVAPATVQARFNLLKAAFVVCLEDDQLGLTANPMEFVKVRNVDTGDKSRDAFTADQLQALFNAPVFTEGERLSRGGKGDTAFWAPLVGLFTGARLDELLSLRTDGLYLHEGQLVFHFRHRPELGQKLKGKVKNNRRVPVHPELIRLGIVDYLRGVEKRGPWLFPEIDRSEKERSHSSAWGAWFGRFLEAQGIKTDTLCFHSFRHTFKHFSRASGLPEDHQDAMTGHTTGEVARRYGSAEGYPVGPLAESMARLKFGTLDLSRVKWGAGA